MLCCSATIETAPCRFNRRLIVFKGCLCVVSVCVYTQ